MKSSRPACALLAAGALLVTFVPDASAAGGWHVVAQTKHKGWDFLETVVAPSKISAWGFGGDSNDHPLAFRWSGSKWSAAPLPALSAPISAASASATGNVWAVGGLETGSRLANRCRTQQRAQRSAPAYALRWDGTKWTVAKRWTAADITAVVAAGAHDVTVYGYDMTAKKPTAWHFDGRAWTTTRMSFMVTGASGTSAKNIWATGATGGHTLVARFDGKKWKTVKKFGAATDIGAITALSAKNVWALGSTEKSGGCGGQSAFAQHWTGKKWNRIAVKAGDGWGTVAPASDGNGGMWFVSQDAATVLLHRSAAGKWTRINPKLGVDGSIGALARIPGTGTLWAAGGRKSDGVILSNR